MHTLYVTASVTKKRAIPFQERPQVTGLGPGVDPGEARRHSADPDGGGGGRFGPSGAEASAPVRYYLEPG